MIARLSILLGLICWSAAAQNITNLFSGQSLYTGFQLTSVYAASAYPQDYILSSSGMICYPSTGTGSVVTCASGLWTNSSFSFWAAIDTNAVTAPGGSSKTVLMFSEGANNYIRVCNDETTPGHCVVVFSGSGTAVMKESTIPVFTNYCWLHVVVTISAVTNVSMYLDTVALSTTNRTGFGVTTAACLVGGRSTAPSGSWGGGITKMRAYARVLSSAEITSLYADIPTQVWDGTLALPGGRFDALDYLGNGVVALGSRVPNPGSVFISTNYGLTISSTNILTTNSIEVIRNVDSAGKAYFLETGTSITKLWATTNYGANWYLISTVDTNTSYFAGILSYDLIITTNGTLLVSDGVGGGGHVFRSTNGGTNWTDLGIIGAVNGPGPLYRFANVGDGLMLNGFAGHLYKSTDDGLTWIDKGKLTSAELLTPSYCGNGVCLQGTSDGHIFRSTDNGNTWTDLGLIDSAGTDDMAYLGDGMVFCSTTGGATYMSTDTGSTWTSIGTLPLVGDWPDHWTIASNGGTNMLIGGSRFGYVLRVASFNAAGQ